MLSEVQVALLYRLATGSVLVLSRITGAWYTDSMQAVTPTGRALAARKLIEPVAPYDPEISRDQHWRISAAGERALAGVLRGRSAGRALLEEEG